MIIVAPFAQKLKSWRENPKNYPYWEQLIELMQKEDNIIQVGVEWEKQLVDDFRKSPKLNELKVLLAGCRYWVSVDSFLQHLAKWIKPWVVIWGQSDPAIFGYAENLNILMAKEYLRKNQFATWEEAEYMGDIWEPAKDILHEIQCVFW